jgi:hypothetical protein
MQQTAEVGRWEGERKTAKKKAREGSRKEAERSEEDVKERNPEKSRKDSPAPTPDSVKKTPGLLDRMLQGDLSPEEGSRIQRIRLLDDIRHAFRHETPLRKEAEEALADYCIAGGFDLPAETSEMRLIAETLAGLRP